MKITAYCGDEQFKISSNLLNHIKNINKSNEKFIINNDKGQRKFTIINVENIFYEKITSYSEEIIDLIEVNIYLEEL